MNNKKILIVEDDELAAEQYSIILQANGYEVMDIFVHAGEALKSVKDNKPDLVISDISLGGEMDGLVFSEILDAQYNIPVIFISADRKKDIFTRSITALPMAYLIKPIDEYQLLVSVELAFAKIDAKENQIRREAHYKEAQEIGNIGSWSWDILNNSLYWSDQIYRIFGLKPQEFGANYESFIEYVHPDDRDDVNENVNRALAGEGPYKVQHRVVQKNGSLREVIERGEVLFNEAGEPIFMQGTVQDMTELHNAQKKVKHMAYYDNVTGLPNRNYFFERIEQSLQLQRRENNIFAVLVVDLDGFKLVNDTYGHDAGDKVLKETGQRIKSTLRDVDVASRVGGDEFIVILWGIKKVENSIHIADKILKSCSAPIHLDNITISLSASIGISICPDHGYDTDTLLKNADQAMYVAKKGGKNHYHLYDPEIPA